jgi:hypothetical protein
MTELIAIIVLGLLCLLQGIERYLYQKDMTNKLNDSIKAVMSRNINEYLTAITTPKNSKEVKGELDQIDLGEADDSTFDKALKKM